jgi:hypothetical protein
MSRLVSPALTDRLIVELALYVDFPADSSWADRSVPKTKISSTSLVISEGSGTFQSEPDRSWSEYEKPPAAPGTDPS